MNKNEALKENSITVKEIQDQKSSNRHFWVGMLILFTVSSIALMILFEIGANHTASTYTEKIYDYNVVSYHVYHAPTETGTMEEYVFEIFYQVDGVYYTSEVQVPQYIISQDLRKEFESTLDMELAKQIIGNVFYNPENPSDVKNTHRESFDTLLE